MVKSVTRLPNHPAGPVQVDEKLAVDFGSMKGTVNVLVCVLSSLVSDFVARYLFLLGTKFEGDDLRGRKARTNKKEERESHNKNKTSN